MKCQYCNAELDENALFCDKCGQSVTDSTKNTDNTNKYWADVEALNNTTAKEHLNTIKNAKAKAKAQSVALIKKIIIATIVVVLLVVSISALNKNSQQKLEFVRSDAIGNTYSDTNDIGSGILFDGDKRDQITVKIKDKNTLSYTRGNYTLEMSGKGDDFSVDWVENEIYESRDYEYTFSTSLFGQITLEFNGKSYEVKTDKSNGTISHINFYRD